MFAIDGWILAACVAATSQAFRNVVQRNMLPVLGHEGAGYIRFLYAMPLAWAACLVYGDASDHSMPDLSAMPMGFWLWVMLGGISQITASLLQLRVFIRRNFAIGTAFGKTEILQAVIFERYLLGIVANLAVTIGIGLGTIAIVMLSYAKLDIKTNSVLANLRRSYISPTSIIGIASGACYALAAVSLKGAVDLLEGDLVMCALTTVAVATSFQSLVMGLILLATDPPAFVACFSNWSKAWLAGLFGGTTTLCWVIGFALYAVAPVQAVGQVELLISVAISAIYYRENITRLELYAIILVAISILIVLLGA